LGSGAERDESGEQRGEREYDALRLRTFEVY
jgi:hypothetical protein